VSISPTFYARFFANIFAQKKLQSQNVTREKLHKALSYKKHACKMLMKLATGVNFTNSLRAAFLYYVKCLEDPFLYIITVWLCNFLPQKLLVKKLLKLTIGVNFTNILGAAFS